MIIVLLVAISDDALLMVDDIGDWSTNFYSGLWIQDTEIFGVRVLYYSVEGVVLIVVFINTINTLTKVFFH